MTEDKELSYSKIIPFQGVRPQSKLAGEIIAPPYDVLNEAEARAIVSNKPKSFLRITRSEVDLAEGSILILERRIRKQKRT